MRLELCFFAFRNFFLNHLFSQLILWNKSDGDSTSSFEWRGFSPSPSSWARRGTAPTPSSWGSGETTSEERGEDCNLRLDHWVSPLKKIQNAKKNTAPIWLSKYDFFYTFDAPPPLSDGGFLPLLLVGQEGGQHLLLWVGGVGGQLWRRGGKTAIQDLITWWVHWKNYKTKKITAPISLSKCKILQIVIFSSQEHSHVVCTYSQPGLLWKKCQKYFFTKRIFF